MKTLIKKKKKIISFKPQIRSRHPTHSVLRNTLELMPFKSVIRLGSTTEYNDTVAKGGNRIELNSVNSIKNSSNKLLMKNCFNEHNVRTANWWTTDNGELFISKNLNIDNCQSAELPYPIVAKHVFGSRGKGNSLLNNKKELLEWLTEKTLSNYIFEKFYNYNREYRLHISEHGCFYTCRKMLKSDTPEDKRWYRNDDNSVWILEENEAFDKPVNWNDIIEQSINALNSVGLDFGAVDLKVQSSKNSKGVERPSCEFIVVEINSAPSFGELTTIKYQEILPLLLKSKFINSDN